MGCDALRSVGAYEYLGGTCRHIHVVDAEEVADTSLSKVHTIRQTTRLQQSEDYNNNETIYFHRKELVF
jgi:hypothetical protein